MSCTLEGGSLTEDDDDGGEDSDDEGDDRRSGTGACGRGKGAMAARLRERLEGGFSRKQSASRNAWGSKQTVVFEANGARVIFVD